MTDKKTPTKINDRKQLFSRITSARFRLYDKICNLDIKALNISEYSQRYLKTKISVLNSELKLYGRLLFLSLENSHISPEDFVLVDYGGGSGIFSFLAIEAGIGTVIYNDIYDVSCKDVGILSNALGLSLDHIVGGDVDELVSFLQKNSISINAITSYDVIEHIYDVESHFKKLGHLSGSKFRIVYASGANIENPRYVRSVKKKQLEVEYNRRNSEWGHKERDTLEAYFEVRKKIISAYAPDLSQEAVEQLARSTRGLIQRDIENCIDEYRIKGYVTYKIDHPTNTCDPYTGNWCEHLMDLDWLERIIENAGFSVTIMPGYYHTSGSLPKDIVKIFLNVTIQLLGRRGMFLAPYYVVFAERRASLNGNFSTIRNVGEV